MSGTNWLKLEMDYLMSDYLGLPFVASDYIKEGEIEVVEGKIVFGTGKLTPQEERQKQIQDEVREIFLESEDMKSWYRYIGEL